MIAGLLAKFGLGAIGGWMKLALAAVALGFVIWLFHAIDAGASARARAAELERIVAAQTETIKIAGRINMEQKRLAEAAEEKRVAFEEKLNEVIETHAKDLEDLDSRFLAQAGAKAADRPSERVCIDRNTAKRLRAL